MHSGMMLGAALVFSIRCHAGQYDKGNKPYILHPLSVMHKLHTNDEELQCIAVLHDAIEDSDATFEDLRNIGMSERVIAGVDALTKRRGETYQGYKDRVKSNCDAVLVKMTDLHVNSDIRRLKGVTQKDFERVQRYHEFWLELKEVKEFNESLKYSPTG